MEYETEISASDVAVDTALFQMVSINSVLTEASSESVTVTETGNAVT